MSEQELAALEGAADDVVVSDTSEALEATENTEGQVEDQPAEVVETEEQKSKSKLRRERREAADRRDREEAQKALEKERESTARLERIKAAAKAVVEPKESDFPDPLEYVAAKSAWQNTQMSARYNESEITGEIEAEKRARQIAAERRMNERVKDFQDGIPEAKTRYADFDAVMNVARNGEIVGQAISEMILESDIPHDLAYHLGKNPEQARALSNMNPVQAAREIGRIEARLSLPKAKTQSTAPDPINPVRGNARTPKNPDGMSPQEYRAWREAGNSF